MADKKFAAARSWELKLQAQQEDLDKREGIISTLEKKNAAMQLRADELQRREETMKAREERCAELECRSMKIVRHEDGAKILRQTTKAEQERLARQQEALAARTAELEKDFAGRESDLRARLAEVESREEKLVEERQEHAAAVEAAAKQLDEREHELRLLEHDLKIRKVQLMEDHTQVQRSIMEMRNKEEEHEQFEKLLKDMQAAEERSRRQLKAQEDELTRGKAQLRIAREDHAAEVQSFMALKEQLDTDRRCAEQIIAQAKAEELSLQKKAAHLNLREREIEQQRKACVEEMAKTEAARVELEAGLKKLEEGQAQTTQLQKSAEVDMKRAATQRERCAAESRQNQEFSRRLKEREQELLEWDEELDRREAEFTRAAESAMNLPQGAPTFAPAQMNRALVSVQLGHMKEQYQAGMRRRAICAFTSPRRRRGQSAGYQRQGGGVGESPSVSRPQSSKSEVVVSSVDVGDFEILSESRRVEMRAVLGPLEKDFRYLLGKISRIQASLSSPEEREALMQKYFTPSERTVVECAVVRERDIGAEVAFRGLIRRSPVAGVQVEADPLEALSEIRHWWRELLGNLNARDEEVLQERYDRLSEAVEILRRRAPQMAGAGKNKRAASAQPLYGLAQRSASMYL